ncbi:GNAT family N-acetyltransferase [bacterium]|nr:GNAT family N-acetyltransferase [bacterium]
MKVVKLRKEDCKNVKFYYHYISDKYYKVIYSETEDGWTIRFKLTETAENIVKDYDELLSADWMENETEGGCQIFGINDNDKIVGWLTVGKEIWTRRLRMFEIFVAEDYRDKGYGKILIEKAKEVAKNVDARSIILETQTNNYNAIEFYKNFGFKLFGCDLSCYHNNDIERNEVRIEMVYDLKEA